MTVSVTLTDGRTDNYMRSHDSYVKHGDGTLDVIRYGEGTPHSYAAGDWADVEGDEKRSKRRLWN